MLFHRRAFLKAIGTLTAVCGLRTVAWTSIQQSSKEKKRYEMEIKRVGSQPSAKGLAEWFTGSVRVD
ncbi:MAG TPA: hypothetical protein VJQ82_09220, partial [Terriglobales bacterium]|nr:hypothetical protein [Terriglobales bacterium]